MRNKETKGLIASVDRGRSRRKRKLAEVKGAQLH
jgi:hypothetical protein